MQLCSGRANLELICVVWETVRWSHTTTIYMLVMFGDMSLFFSFSISPTTSEGCCCSVGVVRTPGNDRIGTGLCKERF